MYWIREIHRCQHLRIPLCKRPVPNLPTVTGSFPFRNPKANGYNRLPTCAQTKYCRNINGKNSRTSARLVWWQCSTSTRDFIIDTLGPRGPFIRGIKMEKGCYHAPSTEFEHGAIGPKSLTFTPAPSRLVH